MNKAKLVPKIVELPQNYSSIGGTQETDFLTLPDVVVRSVPPLVQTYQHQHMLVTSNNKWFVGPPSGWPSIRQEDIPSPNTVLVPEMSYKQHQGDTNVLLYRVRSRKLAPLERIQEELYMKLLLVAAVKR
jgi:hypothetical protein